METISTELLDAIELYLDKRVDIDWEGHPNEAMSLLMDLQRERERQPHDADQPLDHNGEPY